jgi:hypothetical protein
MNLYKINDQLFLHRKKMNEIELQDVVSGIMKEYRKEVVPQYKKIAELRNSGKNDLADKLEKDLPDKYNYIEKFNFVLVNISAEAKTNFEVLESEEIDARKYVK